MSPVVIMNFCVVSTSVKGSVPSFTICQAVSAKLS